MDSSNVVRWLTLACISASLTPLCLQAQSTSPIQARLRPIGSPSAVDAYRQRTQPVQQVSMMQLSSDGQPIPQPSLPSSGGFGFPTGPVPANPVPQSNSPQGGFGFPPSGSLPVPLQSGSAGPIVAQPAPRLPINPNLGPQNAPVPVPPPNAFANQGIAPFSSSGPFVGGQLPGGVAIGPTVPRYGNDYAAIPPPQLDNQFATMDNCRNITGPSSYRAAGVFGGCGAPSSYSTPVVYNPPPSQIAPAVALPPSATFAPIGLVGTIPPVLPGSAGYRPLLSFGQGANPVQVGQGILGQPVAYVPGQFFRNALRYISP